MLSLAGCGESVQKPANHKEEMFEAVARDLKDPASAQFRDIKLAVRNEKLELWCGGINGKNSYGGYTGFKNFYAKADIKGDRVSWDVFIAYKKKDLYDPAYMKKLSLYTANCDETSAIYKATH